MKHNPQSFVKTFIVFSLLFSLQYLAAQNLPPTRVSTFTYSPGINPSDADKVSHMVESYFTNAGRFNLIANDRTAVDAELDRQKDGIYLNGYMVEQNKAIGARYLVVGHVLSTEEGLDYATVQLGVVDVETGENVAVETMSSSGRTAATLIMATEETEKGLSYSYTNRKERNNLRLLKSAMAIASKKRLEKNVKDYLDEHFPMTFMITGMNEDGDRVTSVELYGYKSHDFRRGQGFEVVQRIPRKMPDGSMATQQVEIASLRVTEVEGDLAQCKVSQKKEQIKLFEMKGAEGITVIKK